MNRPCVYFLYNLGEIFVSILQFYLNLGKLGLFWRKKLGLNLFTFILVFKLVVSTLCTTWPSNKALFSYAKSLLKKHSGAKNSTTAIVLRNPKATACKINNIN